MSRLEGEEKIRGRPILAGDSQLGQGEERVPWLDIVGRSVLLFPGVGGGHREAETQHGEDRDRTRLALAGMLGRSRRTRCAVPQDSGKKSCGSDRG